MSNLDAYFSIPHLILYFKDLIFYFTIFFSFIFYYYLFYYINIIYLYINFLSIKKDFLLINQLVFIIILLVYDFDKLIVIKYLNYC